jgi:hypothetical protein
MCALRQKWPALLGRSEIGRTEAEDAPAVYRLAGSQPISHQQIILSGCPFVHSKIKLIITQAQLFVNASTNCPHSVSFPAPGVARPPR